MSDYVVGGYGDEYAIRHVDGRVEGPWVVIGSGCARLGGCLMWDGGEQSFMRPDGGPIAVFLGAFNVLGFVPGHAFADDVLPLWVVNADGTFLDMRDIGGDGRFPLHPDVFYGKGRMPYPPRQ